MSAARAAIRLSPGVCLGVSPFLRRPKCFSMSGKKLPVLKGFRTCIDNKKSLLHLPGQSRSRGHPSVKFSLRPARPLSLLLDFSALYDFLRPAHKGASSPFSHHDFKHCAASILRRSSAHSLFHGAGGCSPADAYQQKNFPLCKSCRFLRAISPIFLLICALGKCCTTSA